MARKRFLISALFLGVLLLVACGEKDTSPAADGDSEVQEREGEAAEPGDSEPDKDLDSDSDSDSALDGDSESDSEREEDCEPLDKCCTNECVDNAIHNNCGVEIDENGCEYYAWKTTPCTDGKVCVILSYAESACVYPDGDAEPERPEGDAESEVQEGDADTETPSRRVLYGPDGLPRSVIKCR